MCPEEPTTPPGELFARFNPQPKEFDEHVASRALQLVRQFDSETLAVFSEYCLAGYSAAETAHNLRSTKSTVIRRLNVIRAKTGRAPARLRALSSHFEKMRDAITDPKARHISPTRLIYDYSGPEENP